MVLVRTGEAPPDARKGRVRLTARDPFIENLLAGGDFDGVNLEAIRAFGKALWRSRNEWSIRRAGAGLFGAREIKRPEAERQWQAAFGRKVGAA